MKGKHMKNEKLEMILEYKKAYEAGESKLSDDEYDALVCSYILEFDGSYNDIYRDELIQDKYPLLSQQNLYFKEDIENHVKKYGSMVATPKYDGVSICASITVSQTKSMVVENIKSRHGKEMSLSVTNCLKELIQKLEDNFKKVCIFDHKTVARFEVILPRKYFDKEKYANPRNYVAGQLNRKEAIPDNISQFSLIPFDISIFKDDLNYLEFVKLMDFPVFTFSDYILNLEVVWKKLLKLNRLEDYDTDGIVFRPLFNYIRNGYGYNKHHWHSECALKNIDSEKITTILDEVNWNITQSGRYIPVGTLNPPAQFKDSKVTKVMLNSVNFIKTMGIKIGSNVTVIKSGDIIPKIIHSDGKGIAISKIVCHYCHTILEIKGANYFCTNDNCPGRLNSIFFNQIRWVQARLGLKGISEKTVDVLHFKGYEIKNFITTIDSDTTIPESLKRLSIPLSNAIRKAEFSIGDVIEFAQIEGIGHETCKKFDSFIQELSDTSNIFDNRNNLKSFLEWEDLFLKFYEITDGLSTPAMQSLHEAMKNSKSDISFLFYILNIRPLQKIDKNLPRYIVTGSLNGLSKKRLQEQLRGKAIVVSTVSKADFLVCNNPGKNSSKYQQAVKKQIPIFDQDEFLEKLNS
jgi:DNA ligase (NAD+)